MDNEKYGIELELIMSKFNEKIQRVKNVFKGINNQQVNLDVNTVQIESLKYQIDQLTSKLNKLKSIPVTSPKFNYGEILKTEASLERLKNQYNKLIGKQNELKTSSTNASLNMTKGLEKVTSKIKRFGLSLLSIRSIWALVSRASSAYLAQDTELANKLQSVWAGLGAMLAPIIEGIVNILAKAVKYINIFIKALTGIDLLARATSKSMNGTAKAAKGLNKALAGFDELNNLDTDAGGGATDIGAGLEGLNDVEIDTTWADRIQKFGKWIKEKWPEVLSLILGTAVAIKAICSGIETIKALGIGLLISGILYTIISLIEYLQNPSWKNFGKIIQGVGIAILGLGIIIGGVPVIVAGAVTLIVGTIIKYWEQIRTFLQGGIDWLTGKTEWVREHFGIIGEAIYSHFVNILQVLLNRFNSIFTMIKGVFDGLITFLKGVFTGNWQKAWEGVKQIFASVWQRIKDVITNVWSYISGLFSARGKIFVGITEGIVSVFKTVVNALISGINKIISVPFNAVNKMLNTIKNVTIPVINVKPFEGLWAWNPLPVPQIPQLAVGTNYVPEDQLAYIHKGEAVVPKKFNSDTYFNRGNEETNSLLQQVIEAINNIEINPYTTIRDVGKASISFINNKSRQLGESVIR